MLMYIKLLFSSLFVPETNLNASFNETLKSIFCRKNHTTSDMNKIQNIEFPQTNFNSNYNRLVKA